MLMDDGASRRLAKRGAAAGLAIILACWVGGCSSSAGSASSGLYGNMRKNRDPNIRYVAYSRRGGRDPFGNGGGMRGAVAARVKKYWEGPRVVERLRRFTTERNQGLPRSTPASG